MKGPVLSHLFIYAHVLQTVMNTVLAVCWPLNAGEIEHSLCSDEAYGLMG